MLWSYLIEVMYVEIPYTLFKVQEGAALDAVCQRRQHAIEGVPRSASWANAMSSVVLL